MRVCGMGRALALVLLVSSVAFGAETLDSVLEDIREKQGRIDSMRADVTMVLRIPLGPFSLKSKAEGTFERLQAEGVSRYRMDVTNRLPRFIPGLGKKSRQDILTVFDGEYIYVETHIADEVKVEKKSPPKKGEADSAGAAFDLDAMRDNLVRLDDEVVDGAGAYVFEVKTEPVGVDGKKPQPTRSLLYIAKDTGMVVRTEVYGEGKAPLLEMAYSNVEINPELDPALFVYTPPSGVAVEDKTEATP